MKTLDNIPVSHTKVIVPKRRKEILTRPRLLEMMLEFLDKKLILISAPAGYGKTSLLIDLSHHSELPFCWLSLDSLDQDLQRFAAYLIEALSKQFPEFGNRARAALNSLTTVEQGMEGLIVTLVNDVYESIPQHFVLILDDFHLISDVPLIQDFLSRFIQLADENCHIIISSRILTKMPDLPLMIARDQVGGLDMSELAFRSDEIQALFRQNYKLQITDETAQDLVDETEGWITGLQLSGLGIAQGMADRLRVARAAGVDLFEYLGQQVLDQQTEDIRFFLLHSSLLEEFDAEFCEAVLGDLYPERNQWRFWVDTVVQYNLFALPVGLESGWVRYHHLFRDFLRDRLKQEHPDRVPVILAKLSKEYESRNEWEKAYHIRRQIGDVNALASMIERATVRLLPRAIITLESWLVDLPPSILKERPGLLSIRGTIEYMKGNLHKGLDLLNQAEIIFREDNNISELALTLARRANAHRYLGDYESALHDSDEVLLLTEVDDDLQLIRADAFRQKGLSQFRQGKSRDSVKLLEQALSIYVRLNDEPRIPILMMEVGMAYRAVGKVQDARQLYDRALKIWKDEGNLYWQSILLNNLGVLHYTQGDYEKAVLALEEGLLCARQSKNTRMEALLLISLGDVYAEVEDSNLAQQSYDQAEETSNQIGDQFLLNYLVLARANLLTRQKLFSEAYNLLERSELTSLEDSQYEWGLYNLIRGRLSFYKGDFPQAIDEFRVAENCFKNDGRQVESVRSQMWLAAVYCQTGKQKAARRKAQEALQDPNEYSLLLTVYQTQNWLNGLRDDKEVGQVLRNLLGKAASQRQKMPGIRRQLRRLARSMDVPDAKLSIRALGSSQVKLGGKTLSMSEWQTQSVRELFFWFLTIKEPKTKEQIGEDLWPEIEDPAKLRLRFKNEIYRLRRAIGKDAILFKDDRYSFNRHLDYEYDVEAFESFVRQAQENPDSHRKIELYQRAINFVRGSFLEDIDATWVLPDRERLSQEYLSALLALANLLMKSGSLQEALDVCQIAMSHEPTFEAAYMLAMKIHAQISDRVSLIRLFDSYEEAMGRELDLPPSKKMKRLYKNLLR